MPPRSPAPRVHTPSAAEERLKEILTLYRRIQSNNWRGDLQAFPQCIFHPRYPCNRVTFLLYRPPWLSCGYLEMRCSAEVRGGEGVEAGGRGTRNPNYRGVCNDFPGRTEFHTVSTTAQLEAEQVVLFVFRDLRATNGDPFGASC